MMIRAKNGDGEELLYPSKVLGRDVPLYEANYNVTLKLYKSKACKIPVIDRNDPWKCWVARGAVEQMRFAIECYIGFGKDAHVVFAPPGVEPYALNFSLTVSLRDRVEQFQKTGKGSTLEVDLKAPTPGRTREARALMNRARRVKIKGAAARGLDIVKHWKQPGHKREALRVSAGVHA